MARKRSTLIKQRSSWSSQQFEFSVNCPYSACMHRLRDFDATLKFRYENRPRSVKGGASPVPPRIEIRNTGETASFEWYSNDSVLVQGTLQSITSESTRFIGTAYHANDNGTTLILFVIILALIVFPFLSAYVQPSSSSSIDIRCFVPLFGIAILLGVGFIFQTDGTINRLVSLFDDCAN